MTGVQTCALPICLRRPGRWPRPGRPPGRRLRQGVGAVVGPRGQALSGVVDVDLLAQQGATVSMKSTTGEVYTNLDLLIDEADSEKNRRSPVGWEIEATIAGGGSKVELESISGDVYFRRAGS